MKYKIEHDIDGHDSTSPFECGELIFLSNHRDYADQNSKNSLNDYCDIEGDFSIKYIKQCFPGCEVIPINAYIHSGIALSLGEFSCRWDSGLFGVLIFKRGEFGENNRGLKGFVESWSQWLNGEIYGYVIEDSEGVEVDSCWGFIGHEHCETEAKEQLKYFKSEAHKARLNKVKQWVKNRVPLNARGFK